MTRQSGANKGSWLTSQEFASVGVVEPPGPGPGERGAEADVQDSQEVLAVRALRSSGERRRSAAAHRAEAGREWVRARYPALRWRERWPQGTFEFPRREADTGRAATVGAGGQAPLAARTRACRSQRSGTAPFPSGREAGGGPHASWCQWLQSSVAADGRPVRRSTRRHFPRDSRQHTRLRGTPCRQPRRHH